MSIFGQPKPALSLNLGGSQAQASQSPFGTTQARPSLFSNPSQSLFGAGNAPQQAPQQQPQGNSSRPLWQPENVAVNPREKTVQEQMRALLEKWAPESPNCLFQHYFYNNVQPETVPYYAPGPGEDEQKWEKALSEKPSEGSVPVLCKGFQALGMRLNIQVQSVLALQARLHEINNSLTSLLQSHDLEVSVRAADARRRHLAQSQRCLQLAAKVQVLRNRGYALEGPEEELKTKLGELERAAFDPHLSGRREEIWARMVGIRDRIEFLQGEMGKGGIETLDEDVLKTTRKILHDYEAQISHLARELGDIKKDFEEWKT